ncbi:MAG: hypothetical protein J2P41_09700 [Blastocatellia bacterium]|nr:hypothetical protein [Blastocatellia bacterium]
MNLIIFISILSLALFALHKLNSRRLPPVSRANTSEIPRFQGLFAERDAVKDEDTNLEAERERMLQRASAGDLYVLDEADAIGDVILYHEILNRLAEGGDAARLRAIAAYIVDSKALRASARFSQTLREQWCDSPDARSLTYLLHLSALSDDAGAFLQAVETALSQWRLGRLKSVSGEDFLAIVESSYWLIATEVRTSGSGFMLKQAIADVRRELAAATRQST